MSRVTTSRTVVGPVLPLTPGGWELVTYAKPKAGVRKENSAALFRCIESIPLTVLGAFFYSKILLS